MQGKFKIFKTTIDEKMKIKRMFIYLNNLIYNTFHSINTKYNKNNII